MPTLVSPNQPTKQPVLAALNLSTFWENGCGETGVSLVADMNRVLLRYHRDNCMQRYAQPKIIPPAPRSA